MDGRLVVKLESLSDRTVGSLGFLMDGIRGSTVEDLRTGGAL
jgi:hypothetical protein